MQQIELPAAVVDCFVANGINGSLIATGISDDDLLEMGLPFDDFSLVGLSSYRTFLRLRHQQFHPTTSRLKCTSFAH